MTQYTVTRKQNMHINFETSQNHKCNKVRKCQQKMKKCQLRCNTSLSTSTFYENTHKTIKNIALHQSPVFFFKTTGSKTVKQNN